MKFRTGNIGLSTAILVVLVCMAFPSIIKLHHAIYEHQEVQCNETGLKHIHNAEYDCEFQKFKVGSTFLNLFIEHPQTHIVLEKKIRPYSYQFLAGKKQLLLSLRGPPFVS